MKKALSLVLALVMIAAMAACGAQGQPAETAKTDSAAPAQETTEEKMEPITLNIAASYADGSDFINYLQQACDAITDKTGGAVNFQIYTSNQLGSVADCMEQMLNGASIVAESGMAVLSSYDAEASIPAYPYVANDYNEMMTLIHSDWWAGVRQRLMENWHMVPIMYFSAGYRNMIGNAPVRGASDLAPCITRIGLGTIGQEFITACGGTPTTTSTFSDCYSALQTGMFELCEADLELLYNCALYEVSDYLSITHHMLCPAVYSVNETVWNSIPAEYQDIILEEFETAAKNIWDNSVAKEAEWISKFEATGSITVIPNSEIDIESFKDTVPSIVAAEGIDASVYEEIAAILK